MKRNGSALILVLGLTALLGFLILGFGRMLRSSLQAASAFYDEAVNTQLARSAYTLAMREKNRASGMPYVDESGNLYFVSNPESYESEIEALLQTREGVSFDRGMMAYRFITKSVDLDPNDLTAPQWNRLLEVACELDDETARAAIADSILDWIDADSNTRENGFEEEDYQGLEPPRHCRNADLETPEELLLVTGMTPSLFYGRGLPAHVEDGVLFGGGLYRFLIGDNSPEAAVSVKYILEGVLPSEDEDETEESDVFTRLESLPQKIYLVAQGFVADPAWLEREEAAVDPLAQQQVPGAMRPFVSHHMMLAVFELPDSGDSVGDYVVEDFQENAAGALLDAVLADGAPEEE